MRIVIIGGGKVGSYLTRVMREAGHVVAVIEQDAGRAESIAEETEALVLEGDGTDVELLNTAGVDRADWVLAVTGQDESNVVACQLAATLGGSRVLARLNNPRNRPTFDALGIPVVAVTDLMVQVISREVQADVGELVRLALLGRGQVSLLEVSIPDDTDEPEVIDLDLPEPSILVTVVRGDKVVVPRANTRLRPGDRVLAVTTVENEGPLRSALRDRSAGSEE
jgi:trk system potassium uptake protein TrkA